jgi:hypothetical protein
MRYTFLIKFYPIGKEIAFITILKLNTVGGSDMLKNFDQWTEELSKEIFVRSDDEDTRVLSKLNEMIGEDYEEE